MKIFRWIWLAFTLGLLGYAFYQGMYVAPTEATMGDIQRIFYYHFPSAMMAFLFFFVSFVASIVYLASRRNHPQRALSADAAALASAEMGMVFCTLVLIQGPLWAQASLGYLVDLGCTPDFHPGSLADLRQLPAAAEICRRPADADPGCGAGHLWLR